MLGSPSTPPARFIRVRLINNKRGFTLIEILIVIVVLGVMAGFAVPVYLGQTQKSYQIEAIRHLSAMRESALRYFAANGNYDGMYIDSMDYNPNTAVGGQTRHYNYSVDAAGGTTCYFTAECNCDACGGAGSITAEIQMNQAGEVSRYDDSPPKSWTVGN